MTPERADHLTLLLIVALAIALWAAIVHAAGSLALALISGTLYLLLLVLLGAVIIWALFGHRLAILIFRPTASAEGSPRSVAMRLGSPSNVVRRYQSLRWPLPVTGAGLLILFYVLYAVGLLSASIAFTAIAALALGSLLFSLVIPDSETESRRADLPVTMIVTWAALYFLKIGLLLELIAGMSWPAFAFGAVYVHFQDRPRWWILAALPILVLYNLIVFYAFYRP